MSDLILTKEQFHKYTIQIVAFSNRLEKLYLDQKEMAAVSKKKWFAENHQDYLLSKETEKNNCIFIP